MVITGEEEGGDGTVTRAACSPYKEDDKEEVMVVGWAGFRPKGEERWARRCRTGPS